MDTKKFLQSKWFIGAVFCVGFLIVVSAAFEAGEFVGYRRAGFSYRWGDEYYQTFGRGGMPGPGGFMMDDFPSTNGVIGKIIKINASSSLVIEGSDKIERIVTLDDDTSIRRFRDSIRASDLHVNDFVVVIGALDVSGTIEARLIRIMPHAPMFSPGQSPAVSTSTKSS